MADKICYRAAQFPTGNSAALRFLYRTVPGRALLRLLCARTPSRLCGRFLDSRLSKFMISPFMRKNGICAADYESAAYRCFNDCFTRKIRSDLRPIDDNPNVLIAPCDGLMSAWRIQEDTVICAKQSRYTLSALLGGDDCAKYFQGGVCLVFRLCVHHYHRYCFPDDGRPLRNYYIPGLLHTVRPIALERFPVFTQNCRHISLLQTSHFDLIAQIEVGAMLVGRICNHPIGNTFDRGAEKGMFLYGGSTVILLLRPGSVLLPDEVFTWSAVGAEIPVQMGEAIAQRP